MQSYGEWRALPAADIPRLVPGHKPFIIMHATHTYDRPTDLMMMRLFDGYLRVRKASPVSENMYILASSTVIIMSFTCRCWHTPLNSI